MGTLKFITDGMLGKLTRWLRLLGCDVEYANDMDDKKLMALSMKEERTLLTQDLELFQQATARGIDTFLVEGRTEIERLACMAKKYDFSLEIDVTVSRCPKCNARIRPIAKEEVADKVERATFKFYSEFWACPECGQTYWQGAHWKRIRETLEQAKKTIKDTDQRKNFEERRTE
jgi:uncharacterized protein with PIN domain